MIRILPGDMLAVLPTLPADSIDSCVCDPPYHLQSIHKRFAKTSLQDDTQTSQRSRDRSDGYARAASGFMGRKWDGGDIAFRPETWAEVLRVLKPGAHLMAFGGTRTSHRMACAIEDAGFEIRDTLCYLYGSGFPKSHDVSKAIDKTCGAVREVIGVSDRHTSKTGSRDFADGQGGFKSTEEGGNPLTVPSTDDAKKWSGWGTALKPAHEPIILARKPLSEHTVAANVLRWGTGALNIDGCRIELADGEPLNDGLQGDYVRMGTGAVDSQWGFKRVDRAAGLGRWPANVCHDGSDEVLAGFPKSAGQQGDVLGTEPSQPLGGAVFGQGLGRKADMARGDTGSAARFFYTSKADATDRLQSRHPTVKPVDLIRWLVRMVTPASGTVLDCFAGSGTTGMAAMAEGFSAILVEREAEYVADIRRRVAHVQGDDTPLFAEIAT
jgi:DNA modification methylase